MNNTLYTYDNGNYRVSIFDNGTKIREADADVLLPSIPENIDCKITNFCDNVLSGCMAHCHEKSNPQGKIGDLELGLNLFKSWQAGCELALGGGSTLSHPDIIPFLQELKKIGIVSNITVNHFHTQTQFDLISRIVSEKLIYGIGCSYIRSLPLESIKAIYNSHLVFHLILGVHTIDDVKYIYDNFENPKILLLGYKQFGNGIGYYSKNKEPLEAELYHWFTNIHTLFNIKGLILSFDNLAIQQLKLNRFFDEDNWNTFYQGDDGFANLYVDLVKAEYAVSSRSPCRFALTHTDTISSIFKSIQK